MSLSATPGPSALAGGTRTTSSSSSAAHHQRRRRGGDKDTYVIDIDDDDDDGPVFTSEMRDRQARGKDPYRHAASAAGAAHDDEDDEDDESDYGFGFLADEDLDGLLSAHARPSFPRSSRRVDDDDDDDDEDDDIDDDSDDGMGGHRLKFGQGIKLEPFEERERRAYALSVLDSPEQLMMFAQSANDSIPSQRLRFSAILAGFEPLPTTADPRKPVTAPRRDPRAKARRVHSDRRA